MAMLDCNTYAHPAKKMKLQEEEISNTNHAATDMKLQEEISKSQDGSNTVNFEDPQPRRQYIVYVVREQFSTREDPMPFFVKMMKDVGCCETQIDKGSKDRWCTFYFIADLTEEEANKLSNLSSVRKMLPYKRETWIYKTGF